MATGGKLTYVRRNILNVYARHRSGRLAINMPAHKPVFVPYQCHDDKVEDSQGNQAK
jgi:hypothetical protein